MRAGLVAVSDKFKTLEGKDRLIDLHAAFADGDTTGANGVDVCTQKVFNPTD